MTATVPTTEPVELRAGDTWKWTRALDDYPASAWTLKYRFKRPTAAGFEIVASADGDAHSVSHAAASTAAYTAGTYTWIAWVEGGSSEKYTVDRGTLVVQPDYRAATAATTLDDRSAARTIYEALLAAYESSASERAFVGEYEIAGRRMKFVTRGEMLKELNYWRSQVAAEDAADAIESGTGQGRRIQFIF